MKNKEAMFNKRLASRSGIACRDVRPQKHERRNDFDRNSRGRRAAKRAVLAQKETFRRAEGARDVPPQLKRESRARRVLLVPQSAPPLLNESRPILQRFYNDLTTILQRFYNGFTTVLQRCKTL